MKKTIMNAILTLIADNDTTEANEVREAINAELSRGAEKAQANRDLYAAAREIVMRALADAAAPVTISELYEAVENDLPEGMTKGKLQYAVTRLWVDEIVKTEGKVNAYALKV